jgi:hypothetical protein
VRAHRAYEKSKALAPSLAMPRMLKKGGLMIQHRVHHAKLEVHGEFEHVSMLFAGPTRPDQPRRTLASLTVLNRSDDPIPFTFNTTQRFEIELVDPEGKVVSRWSDGQMFGQIVSTENLPSRTSWHFHGELTIPAGGLGERYYTTRIYVTADIKPGAQSPLKITVAP